ncbi:hypothetical protein MTQ10_21895 [Streptomyces sp. XM83C]|uniref:Uncharacterized protein n=1 Tax=Streptomyces thermocoprophilus TaxID=78356 RepID=A0ABV5VHW6_9ACTN|nr:hypothetical protein [Streptomyces sp. XM83C]MCK1822186.1 hypothetical protein [Streptomyces sp. XM83C]
MRARRPPGLIRSLGRSLGEGVMWMGFGWFAIHLPHPWTGYVIPPGEQPCLPPLPQEEIARRLDLLEEV